MKLCECSHASCYHRLGKFSDLFSKGNVCNMNNCACLRFTPTMPPGADGQAMPSFRY